MSETYVVKYRTAAGGIRSVRILSESAEAARAFAVTGSGIPADAIRSVEPAVVRAGRASFIKTIPGKH